MKIYKCECGREFEKSQSYIAHCGHCKTHLGRDPLDRFGDSRAWMKGKTSNDPIYGESIKRCHHKKDLSEILVRGRYVSTNHLKWRLVNEGVKEWRCENCKNTEWLNNVIPLELHHKDGDKSNNELDNLELLCPNCHALTNTYRGKNMRIKIKIK